MKVAKWGSIITIFFLTYPITFSHVLDIFWVSQSTLLDSKVSGIMPHPQQFIVYLRPKQFKASHIWGNKGVFALM